MDDVTALEPGDKIGYRPVGTDERQVGIVKQVNDIDVTVTMPDDPGIEERVPFDRIGAVEGADER